MGFESASSSSVSAAGTAPATARPLGASCSRVSVREDLGSRGEVEVWGGCRSPISPMDLRAPCPDPVSQALPAPTSLPRPSQPPRTQLWCCQLTVSPCLHRHPGDGLCVCYYCCRRQPCSHSGLLHGRAAAVWLPGAPRAGPTTTPGPARHPWAPWPHGLPRWQCCLGMGRLR